MSRVAVGWVCLSLGLGRHSPNAGLRTIYDHMQANETAECTFTCIRKQLTKPGVLNTGSRRLGTAEGPGGDTAHVDTGQVCGFCNVTKATEAAPQGAVTLRPGAQQGGRPSQHPRLAGVSVGIPGVGAKACLPRAGDLGPRWHSPLLPDQWL